MEFARHRHAWIAGLILAGAGLPAARAQEVPTAPPALPAPTLPAPAPEELLPAGPAGPGPAPAAAVATAPAAGACSCGNRRGFSRWRWHRSHCKRHFQEHFAGFAEEFNEWPLGESVYAHARTQVANGQAARMVFNHYDFVEGTPNLNVRGQDKLAAIAATLPTNFFPIVVERTPRDNEERKQRGQPPLDQQRKTMLVAQLAQGPFPVPSERVVIGPRIANGMTGYEAGYGIWPRQFSNLVSGGAIGQASSTSFVGGGLDFSAGGLSGGTVGGFAGGAAGGLGPVGAAGP